MISQDILQPEAPKPLWRRPNKSTLPDVPDRQFMTKVEYAKWVEQKVKVIFPKGSFVTFKALSETKGRLPPTVFKIIDIQEIHWNAPLDYIHKEPKCLVLKALHLDPVVMMAPSNVRHLTDEELQLALTRHPESAEVPAKEVSRNESGTVGKTNEDGSSTRHPLDREGENP